MRTCCSLWVLANVTHEDLEVQGKLMCVNDEFPSVLFHNGKDQQGGTELISGDHCSSFHLGWHCACFLSGKDPGQMNYLLGTEITVIGSWIFKVLYSVVQIFGCFHFRWWFLMLFLRSSRDTQNSFGRVFLMELHIPSTHLSQQGVRKPFAKPWKKQLDS